MTSIYFGHYTRDQISRLAATGAAVVVPLAATEQHGPHLPVATDAWIAERVIGEAVTRASTEVPLLMTPVCSIGCSAHHLEFGGTLSFSSRTYMTMLRELGESLIQCGFGKLVFLNSHGGNEPVMTQVASDLAVEYPVWTASASYWSVAADALQTTACGDLQVIPGHAGTFETSLVMALRPELVQQQDLKEVHPICPWIHTGPRGAFIGRHKQLTGVDGYTDAPANADAEKGKRYLETIISACAAWLERTIRTMMTKEGSES